MASCPSCGSDARSSGGSCPRCGAAIPAGVGLELDVPARKPQKAQAKKKQEVELNLELAVDPRSLVQPAASETAPASGPRSRPEGAAPGKGAAAGPSPSGGSAALAARLATAAAPAVGEVRFDAQLLADYGEPPGHWLLAGLYAWRVLRRQREIKRALVGRREEAARTATALEDALVAFAERARPFVDGKEKYTSLFAEARSAEETLRSRDAVLAADQDAHKARLGAVAARLANLEAELAAAQGAERAVATEIASNQGALGRAESKLKRAESELRAAAREGVGTEP